MIHKCRSPPLPGTTRPSLLKAFADYPESDTDISFVSSDRPSTDRNSSLMFDSFIDSTKNSRLSTSTDYSMGSLRSGVRWSESNVPPHNFSCVSFESGRSSCSSQNLVRSNHSPIRFKIYSLYIFQVIRMFPTTFQISLYFHTFIQGDASPKINNRPVFIKFYINTTFFALSKIYYSNSTPPRKPSLNCVFDEDDFFWLSKKKAGRS